MPIDQKTRYPEVEVVSSTGFKQTKEKQKMFAHHGTPRRVLSDTGPPFSSKAEYSDFAEEEGFQHPRVTPGHPRANGQVCRNLCKLSTKQSKLPICKGKQDLRGTWPIEDMLMAYRNTPHPATGVSPYQYMMYRPIRTKLGHPISDRGRSKQDKQIDELRIDSTRGR